MKKKIELSDEEKKDFNSRVCQIRLFFFENNNRAFANCIDVNEQNISNVCSENSPRNTSLALVKRIIERVPNVSAKWLITGEGDIMIDDSHQTAHIRDNSGIIVQHGDNSTYNNNSEFKELVRLIVSQQQTIQCLTEQNKTLTQLITNK